MSSLCASATLVRIAFTRSAGQPFAVRCALVSVTTWDAKSPEAGGCGAALVVVVGGVLGGRVVVVVVVVGGRVGEVVGELVGEAATFRMVSVARRLTVEVPFTDVRTVSR